jgi:hypothetical protein
MFRRIWYREPDEHCLRLFLYSQFFLTIKRKKKAWTRNSSSPRLGCAKHNVRRNYHGHRLEEASTGKRTYIHTDRHRHTNIQRHRGTDTDTCAHTRTDTDTDTDTHAHRQTDRHRHTRTHIWTRTDTQTHPDTQTQTRTHMDTHTWTRTDTQTHRQRHTQTRTHTDTRTFSMLILGPDVPQSFLIERLWFLWYRSRRVRLISSLRYLEKGFICNHQLHPSFAVSELCLRSDKFGHQ